MLLLSCKILTHLLYSLGISVLGFHLSWSLKNSLNGRRRKKNSLKDSKRHLEKFFAEKDCLWRMEL